MPHFLFLKFARPSGTAARNGGLLDSGIDIRLLSLLSARYV